MDIGTITQKLLEGSVVSLEIFAVTLVGALILGLLLCFVRMSRFMILRIIAKIYISIMRGTPLMLQLFVVYFGPYYLFHIELSPSYKLIAVFIGFVLNYAAYFAEIFRAGIQAIGRGQYEAAKTLGMTYPQTMRRIIIPQMIRHVLPPISNETINLVKDTSLIYILAMNDLLRVARTIVQREFDMTPFVIAGVFYLVMTFVLTWAFKKLEAHYAKYDQ